MSLIIDITSYQFSCPVGGPNPSSKNVSVTGTNGTAFTVTTDQAWLTTSPTSGTIPATIAVSANQTGLADGVHTGHVLFKVGGVTQQTLTVLFGVYTSGPAWSCDTTGYSQPLDGPNTDIDGLLSSQFDTGGFGAFATCYDDFT